MAEREYIDAEKQQAETRVMTFNVRGSDYPDGVNAWANRKSLNLAVVRMSKPHLLGVQEAQYGTLWEYTKRLHGLNHIPGPFLERGEFNPIYWDNKRMELLETDLNGIALHPEGKPNTPAIEWGSHTPRGATWAVLLDHQTGQKVAMVNYHPDHISERARYESAKLVLQQINKFGRIPTIVTADFNDGEYIPPVPKTTRVSYSGKSFEVLRDAGFIDTFSALHEDGPGTNTWHMFKGENYNPADDYGLYRVDGIWVRGLDPVFSEIIKTARPPVYSSDHYPVVSVVK